MAPLLPMTDRIPAALLVACSVTCSFAVLSCGESSGRSAWDGVVRDSAGVQIVENSGTPLWGEGETWEFTEVLRIGVATGAPEYEFGRITGLAVLSDRRIVVADALGHHVRYFSPDGIHQSTVGTAGRGPGDFGGRDLALFQGPGDTLVVLDRQNGRAHRLAPDGTWLGGFSWQTREEGYIRTWPSWKDDAQSGALASEVRPVIGGPIRDPRHIILLRDVHGAVLDTLTRLPPNQTITSENERPGGMYFPGRPVFHLFCGVLVTGRTDAPRLRWYDLDGTLRRIVGLAREPAAMTEEDRSMLVHQFELWWQENNYSPARVERERDQIGFRSTYPAYRMGLVSGPAGTLLVQQVRPLRDLVTKERNRPRPIGAASPPGSPNWDVLDCEGRFLGEVVFPDAGEFELGRWGSAPLTRFAHDPATDTWYMYSVRPDENDVEYVVVWRIDGPMPG